MLDDSLDEGTLVDRFFVEAGAEGQDAVFRPLRPQLPRHQADDRGTVQPTRQAGADRHIGAQVNPDRFLERLAKALDRLGERDVERLRMRDAIPAARLDAARTYPISDVDRDAVAGAQLLHPGEHRLAGVVNRRANQKIVDPRPAHPRGEIWQPRELLY